VLVQHGGMLVGYLAEGELEYGLNVLGTDANQSTPVRVLGTHLGVNQMEEMGTRPDVSDGDGGEMAMPPDSLGGDSDEMDLSPFVDRTPLTIMSAAPMEYAVEMFGKLGLRYLIVTDQGSSKVVGVIIKKRMVSWLDSLKHSEESDW